VYGNGRVEAGDALRRRLEVEERLLVDERDDLRAEAAALRRLVHHDDAAGLLDRLDDGVDVERPEGPQVDDLAVSMPFSAAA
jgi:hypothetical protein